MDPLELLQQLEILTKNPPRDVLADDALRRKLRDAARNLSIAMETPGDTVHRIGSLVVNLSPQLYGLTKRGKIC
jgi:hypothetical protein